MKTQVSQFTTDDVKPGRMHGIFLGRKGPVTTANGQMIFWEFEVEQDGETKVVSGVTSDSFNHDSRCKAMKWAQAIDISLTDQDLEWDDEQAIGNECIIEVVYREVGDQLISSVKEVLPWLEKSLAI